VTVPANLTAGNSTITVSNSDGTGVVTVGTFNVTAAGGGVVTRLMGGAIQGTPLVLSTTVSTLVGPVTATPTSSPIMAPTGVTTDGTNLYVANSGTIYKVVIATGAVTTLASQPGAYGITTDGTNLYVTYFTFDLTTYTGTGGVSKIAISTGVVSPLAGAAAGYAEGTGSAALFNTPSGITTDGSNLYVADKGNNAIRKIVIATGQVTTLAGAGWQTFGSADGIGSAATFHFPRGVVTDGTNLYVADTYSEKIRKIVISSATVTTLAGSGTQAYTDGTGIAASFNWPTGITTDGTNLYVTSQNAGSHNVRKVVISSGVVTTIAGNAYAQATDGVGTAASFYNPNGITSDGTNLYVADFNNNKIRKIQ
jgi:sugar lactone lactonase YvrE